MNVVFLLPLVLALFAIDVEAKNCRKGKPCGNTCIAMNRTCHVGGGSYTPPARPSSPSAALPARPSGYTVPSPSSRQEFSSIAAPIQREQLYVQSDVGFIMDEPSSSAFQVRKPVIGEMVTVYRSENGWVRISAIDTPVEWILRTSLGPKKPILQTSSPSLPTMMPVTEAGFIMDRPAHNANRVRRLNLSDVFNVYQTAGEWVRVTHQHEPAGWVLMEHLAP